MAFIPAGIPKHSEVFITPPFPTFLSYSTGLNKTVRDRSEIDHTDPRRALQPLGSQRYKQHKP